MSLAPNAKGHVGGTYSWGSGVNTTHYYPGTAAFVDDDRERRHRGALDDVRAGCTNRPPPRTPPTRPGGTLPVQ